MYVCVWEMCACMCVCVKEKEREKKGTRERNDLRYEGKT